jgi:hypothetical protein
MDMDGLNRVFVAWNFTMSHGISMRESYSNLSPSSIVKYRRLSGIIVIYLNARLPCSMKETATETGAVAVLPTVRSTACIALRSFRPTASIRHGGTPESARSLHLRTVSPGLAVLRHCHLVQWPSEAIAGGAEKKSTPESGASKSSSHSAASVAA